MNVNVENFTHCEKEITMNAQKHNHMMYDLVNAKIFIKRFYKFLYLLSIAVSLMLLAMNLKII